MFTWQGAMSHQAVFVLNIPDLDRWRANSSSNSIRTIWVEIVLPNISVINQENETQLYLTSGVFMF